MFALPDPHTPQLWLVAGAHGLNDLMIEFAARLALRGALQELSAVVGEARLMDTPLLSTEDDVESSEASAHAGELVRVLDAGNGFNAHRCSRLLAHLLYRLGATGQTHGVEGQRPRSGRHIFYQWLSLPSLLERVRVARAFTCYQVHTLLAQTPASPRPTLVLDVVSSFYDEDVPLPEARRLFMECLEQLQRLCQLAPVVVSARPPDPQALTVANRIVLLETLVASAQRVITLKTPQIVDPQLSFGI